MRERTVATSGLSLAAYAQAPGDVDEAVAGHAGRLFLAAGEIETVIPSCWHASLMLIAESNRSSWSRL